MKRFFILMALTWTVHHSLPAQPQMLRDRIAAVCTNFERHGGRVGVAARHFEKRDTASWRGGERFPMQSVFKFPLAMAVLHGVDEGRFAIDQKIHITQRDMLPDTWSPLAKKYPEGNVDVSIRDLLFFTVAQSDNNGCDVLFRLLGGPEKVQTYIHSLGVKDIAFAANEEEMHADWNAQFTNWCHPRAMEALLLKLHEGKVLSATSTSFLMNTMIETATGPNRLKGQLPAGTVVAHKTGTDGANAEGIIGAVNDAGIITLPDGSHVSVVVYVSGIRDEKRAESVIATLAKTIYDLYTAR